MILLLLSMAGALALMTAIIAGADYSSSRSVYGKMLTDEELGNYFAKHLMEYDHVISKTILSSEVNMNLPPIFELASSGNYFSKYTINDYGQIPRWSAYHNVVKAKFDDFRVKKGLADL